MTLKTAEKLTPRKIKIESDEPNPSLMEYLRIQAEKNGGDLARVFPGVASPSINLVCRKGLNELIEEYLQKKNMIALRAGIDLEYIKNGNQAKGLVSQNEFDPDVIRTAQIPNASMGDFDQTA